MVDGTPQIVGLPADLYEDFIQMPLCHCGDCLTRSDRRLRILVGQMHAETVRDWVDRFVADIDTALIKQVFDIAER